MSLVIFHRFLKNDLYFYFSANILRKFFISVSGILLARFFSQEEFGILKTIIVFIGLVSILLNFGMDDLLLFKISQNNIKNIKFLLISDIIKNFIYIYIISFPISLVLFLSVYHFYNFTILSSIILFTLFYFKFFFDWILTINNKIFQAKNEFFIISLIILMNSSLILCVILILYIFKKGLIFYGVGLLLVSIITDCLTLFFSKGLNWKVFKKVIIKNIINNKKLSKNLLKNSFPFFISQFMAYIYMQSDILILSIIKGPKEVSRYTVATTIIFTIYLIPSVGYNYFLPKITLYFKNRLKLRKIYNKFLLYISFFATPAGCMLFFFSERVLDFMYTQKYINSFLILKILSIVFIFHSFCFLFGALLTASGNQMIRSKIQTLAALINILLNIMLIPYYNAEGAALATAITEIVIFMLYFYFTIKILKQNFWGKKNKISG